MHGRLMKTAMLLIGCTFAAQHPAAQESPQCPELQNTRSALLEPDKYAWELLVALNQPGDRTTKCNDASREFGAEGPVLWETWRNARNGAADTAFPSDGSDPGPWLEDIAPELRLLSEQENRLLKQVTLASQRVRTTAAGDLAVAFDPVVGEFNEVRLNRPTYEFIRDNSFYNRDKLVEAAGSGIVGLGFPAEAKEIKAQWRKIRTEDRPRYHWSTVQGPGGAEETWGLTALHITTKNISELAVGDVRTHRQSNARDPAGRRCGQRRMAVAVPRSLCMPHSTP